MCSCALCTLASSVAGTCFVTCCNQCNLIVFVIGFPFKLLDVTSLQTVFFIFSPLCLGCYSLGIEFLQAYIKRAELVNAYMGIRGNDTHMSSSPPPLSSAAVIRRHLVCRLPLPLSAVVCRWLPPVPIIVIVVRCRRCCRGRCLRHHCHRHRCHCRRRHLPPLLPVICLIVVCITTESVTVSSSFVFVSSQPSFLLPTCGGRLAVAMSGHSLIIQASIAVHPTVALTVFFIVIAQSPSSLTSSSIAPSPSLSSSPPSV